jgi:hypothetical protein
MVTTFNIEMILQSGFHSRKDFHQEVFLRSCWKKEEDVCAISPYKLYVLSFDLWMSKASDDILPLVVNFLNSN